MVPWNKMKTSHKQDVTCLDISDTNQMVTASLDNLIIFWNSYTRKEAKHIVVTDDIAPKSRGVSIQ